MDNGPHFGSEILERKNCFTWGEIIVEEDVGQGTDFASGTFGDKEKMDKFLSGTTLKAFCNIGWS